MTEAIKIVIEARALVQDDETRVVCKRLDGTLHRVHNCPASMIATVPEGWIVVYAIKRSVGKRVNELLLEVEVDEKEEQIVD